MLTLKYLIIPTLLTFAVLSFASGISVENDANPGISQVSLLYLQKSSIVVLDSESLSKVMQGSYVIPFDFGI